MRIGILIFAIRESGGLYQYTETILKAISGLKTTDEYIVFTWDDNIMQLKKFIGERYKIEKMPAYISDSGIKNIQSMLAGDGLDLIQSGFNLKAKHYFLERKVDLLIYPSPVTFTFEFGIPYIMAIHDLQHRLQPEFPEVSAGGIWYSREYLFRNAIRYAEGILVDSDVGKEDVLTFYGDLISPDHVYVLPFLPAYHPKDYNITDTQKESLRKKYNLPNSFIFYPAQFWLHKNHARLIHSIHKIRFNKNIDIPLVFVGSKTGIKPEAREFVFDNVMSLAEQLDVKDLVYYLGYVPDEDMPILYSMAVALAMPTFFGPTNIPVLEAWAFGCPVLTSNIRGIKDQVGDAGLLINPNNVDEIADGICRLWTDEGLREKLRKEGYKKIESYNLEDFTKKLSIIIEDVKTCLEKRMYFDRQKKQEQFDSEVPLDIQKSQTLSDTISRINKLISSNKLIDADIAIRRALLDYPDEPEILNLKAVLNMVQGNNEDAKLILLDLIEKNDSFIPGYNNLAMISWTSGNFEDAMKYFDKALSLSNYERSIVVSYGEMLIAYKKYQKAKEVFEDYLKIAPEDEEIKGLVEKCEGVLGKVKRIGMLIKDGQNNIGIESKFENTEKKELKFVSADEFLKKNPNSGSFFELVKSKKGDVTHNMYILNDFILASPLGFPISKDGDVIKDKYIYFHIFNKYLENILFYELFRNLPEKKKGKYLAIYGDWAEGFWHWMMENLPVILLAEEKGFDGYYIIPNTRFARESLELLGISHERIIEYQGENIYVETLYLPKKIPGWRLDEFPEVIDKLRNSLLESVGYNEEKTKKRIYISRNKLGSQRRIVINEDALLKLLGEFGFETIYTEEMSLREQILTMANAEALITPHGSGMVHTLFMPHGSLVIELFAPTYINPCMLSIIRHLKHRYFMVPSYLNKVPPVYDYGWDIEAYLYVIKITMEREIGEKII